MGKSWFYGYTEKKAKAKAEARGMTLGMYGNYLEAKQRATRPKKRRARKNELV